MHFRMTVALCFLGDEFQVAFRCPKTAAKIYGISECIKNDSVSVAVPGSRATSFTTRAWPVAATLAEFHRIPVSGLRVRTRWLKEARPDGELL